MKITKEKVIRYRLTEIKGLDPIDVIVENYEIGQGKIIIECFGESWSHYWGGMGKSNIEQFFQACDKYYLAGKLSRINEHETDWGKINEDSVKSGLGKINEGDGYSKEATDILIKLYGEDWRFDLPQKTTTNREYLWRIVETIKEAFKDNNN